MEARERISGTTEFAMMLTATLIWAISFIPLINIFANVIGWIVMGVWFKLCGASLIKNKGKNITSLLIAFIPLIGTLLSAFPMVIYINIKTAQKEDAAALAAKNQADSQQYAQETRAMTARLQQQENEEGEEGDTVSEETRIRQRIMQTRPLKLNQPMTREKTRTDMPMTQITRKRDDSKKAT